VELYLWSPYTPPPHRQGQIHLCDHIKENEIRVACSTQIELKFVLAERDHLEEEAWVS